jgi:phosphopantetheinyl transferase
LHLGNDIVDLKTTDARGKAEDRRFVQRVLTSGEQKALAAAEHPDELLWTFWAAKEAAYKAVSKTAPGISSAPRRYQVIIDGQNRQEFPDATPGHVETPGGIVLIRVYCRPDWIHCIASAHGPAYPPGIKYGITTIADGNDPASARESTTARRAVRTRLASELDIDPDAIRIVRNMGLRDCEPPMVQINGRPASIDISLSHDGRFAAYAFYNPERAARRSMSGFAYIAEINGAIDPREEFLTV